MDSNDGGSENDSINGNGSNGLKGNESEASGVSNHDPSDEHSTPSNNNDDMILSKKEIIAPERPSTAEKVKDISLFLVCLIILSES